MPGLQMLVEELTCTASIARSKYLTSKDGVVMTNHLGNIFWDGIIKCAGWSRPSPPPHA